jgi:phytoene dehydrogenase-like protein
VSSSAHDVVVVGAGHNALVAACYLARAGLDVAVVEQDTVVGGACSTVERWPGYRVDRGSSLHVMVRHTGIPEELELADCGLRYLDLPAWGYAPFGDEAITFHTDLDATCASIEAVCGRHDADAYRAFATEWAELSASVFALFQRTPTGAAVGRGLVDLNRRSAVGLAETTRAFFLPGDHLLDATFRDERLRTALAWLGAQSGPPTHEVGTAALVGWNPLMHRVPPARPVGGSGALAEALAERLRRLGGTLRLGDGATAITRSPSGRVDGVRTASGDHLTGRAVLAGCHVLTTFELLGDPAWSDRVTRQVRVGNGLGMVVRVGATDLPRYPSAAGNPLAHTGMQLLAPSREHLRRAYGEFSAGQAPKEPAVLAMSFSAIDPTIAPPGRHQLTLWAQWHPYALADGSSWDDRRDEAGDAILEQVERAAPGFRDTVEHVHVQTPLDLERELGLRRGNVMHVEMGLDAMFSLRPLPELAGYRTPVDGLYLTGASTHPGGGVFGASGRSAAAVLAADLQPRRHLRKAGRARLGGAHA